MSIHNDGDIDMAWGQARAGSSSNSRQPSSGVRGPSWWASPPVVISKTEFDKYSAPDKKFDADRPPEKYTAHDASTGKESYCLASRKTDPPTCPVYKPMPYWWASPPKFISSDTRKEYQKRAWKIRERPKPYTYLENKNGDSDSQRGLLQAVLVSSANPIPVTSPVYQLGAYPGCPFATSMMPATSSMAVAFDVIDSNIDIAMTNDDAVGQVVDHQIDSDSEYKGLVGHVIASKHSLNMQRYLNADDTDPEVYHTQLLWKRGGEEVSRSGTPCVSLEHDFDPHNIAGYAMKKKIYGPVYRPYLYGVQMTNLMAIINEHMGDLDPWAAASVVWKDTDESQRILVVCQRVALRAGPFGTFRDESADLEITDRSGSESDGRRHR